MFRSPAPGPQPGWKRPVYLVCTTLLFIILSFGFHAIIEQWIIRSQPVGAVQWYTFFGGQCALPPLISYSLLIAGLIAGPLIGRAWWRWVYVERRWSEKTTTPPTSA